jgi:hypothetical protein
MAQFAVEAVEWRTEDEGVLKVSCLSLGDYKALVAHLSEDRPANLLVNQVAVAVSAVSDQPDHPSSAFPGTFEVRVRRNELPPNSTRWIFAVGSNFLRTSAYMGVVEITWQGSGRRRRAELLVRCEIADEYTQLRHLLDVEPSHASMMTDPRGGGWYVYRVSDTGSSDDPFPQVLQLVVQEVPPEEREVPTFPMGFPPGD